MKLAKDISCRSISDVGCAAGGFYRFFREYAPHMEYRGFDLSPVAIKTAESQFKEAYFRLFDGNLKTNPDIRSDIVFCRDVVHHQPQPFDFLSDLYDLSDKYLLLRIRTRETGPTIVDPELSCQYTYGKWVPFIVLNTTELLGFCQSLSPKPHSIIMRQHKTILGGQTGRFLPKDLYYEETGSAQTAMLIQKGNPGDDLDLLVDVRVSPELDAVENIWAKMLKRLARKWGIG